MHYIMSGKKVYQLKLLHCVKKCENRQIDWDSPAMEGLSRLTPNYTINKIFLDDEEVELCNFLQMMAKLHHGLTPKNVRKLAFDLAVANNKNIPASWHQNQSAGKFWMTSLLKRNKNLSIRSAEATSLGRAMGFNKPIVERFYANLKQIYEKYNLGPDQIYNMDETALTTVQGSGKVIATKGQKQVGQITSNEREVLGASYPLAFSQKNCISGFQATGIFPYNNTIFSDDDFLAADVTNLSLSRTDTNHVDDQQAGPSCLSAEQHSEILLGSEREQTPPNTLPKTFISPNIIKPLPKAQNVPKQSKRKKKTTEILTSSPVYKKIEEEQMLKEARQADLQKKEG
ncbi:hypothetical protein NQ315_005654 [Exocentrus adspersus]|uniref:DDE-1 domain-containing protein n=1 Tax=Exocentrus adspersus TaxID=1586481 RepID=A0AAV8V7L0_9CUCU|nr:hypothetical protein NQ315_005654 [Exocentrus adspersus]